MNIYIVYEINLWPFNVGQDFAPGNFWFQAVTLTKNADFDKHKYSGYGIGSGTHGSFSLFDVSGFGKSVIIFGADISLSVHIDSKKKDILILGKGPTDGTTLTAEKEYFVNFTEQHKQFCLSLHYYGINNYKFVNGVGIYKFKSKDSQISTAPLCLGNVSKDFPADNKKNFGLYGMFMILIEIFDVDIY